MGNQKKVDDAIEQLPGYYIRRLHQIAVARFMVRTEAFGVTPVQWASLRAAQSQPGIDQRTLARQIGFDTSTIGGVIDRLEKRGLIERRASAEDRRVRQLVVTPEGSALLKKTSPLLLDLKDWLLEPLPPKDRERFLEMMRKLVDAHGAPERTPVDGEL